MGCLRVWLAWPQASQHHARSHLCAPPTWGRGADVSPEQWALELEDQVRRFARRVSYLWRRNRALVELLRSIKDNGGCGDIHWRAIEVVLHREDSGRAVRVEQKAKPQATE